MKCLAYCKPVAVVKAIALAAAVVGLSACSTPVPSYGVSGENVRIIREMPKPLVAGQFSGSPSDVSCRLQPLKPDGSRTFAQYLKDALNKEILLADQDVAGEPVAVNVDVSEVRVDCGVIDGLWIMNMTVSVNGKKQQIVTRQEFDGNYLGIVVLKRAEQAFSPAAEKAVRDILTSGPVKDAMQSAGSPAPTNTGGGTS